jgi:hypothetical protein
MYALALKNMTQNQTAATLPQQTNKQKIAQKRMGAIRLIHYKKH